jgi:diguanylate cyclase (GGDEF)-like protein
MPDVDVLHVSTSSSQRATGPLEVQPGRRMLPFAVAMLFAMVAATAFAADLEPRAIVASSCLAVGLIAASLWLPWSRLPTIWQSLPAFAWFGLVALMRDAVGGRQSGAGVLVLLPVTWLALYGTRRQVVAALACTVTVFVAPLALVGAPTYTIDDWRKAVILTAVAALVAHVVSRNVSALEAGKLRAETLAADLAVTEANLAAVSAAGRELRTSHDVRPAIAEQMSTIAAAETVMLLEPDGVGSLTQTASVGFANATVHIPLGTEASGAVRAMVSGRSEFVEHARSDPQVSGPIAYATGLHSALFEPLLRDGRAVGVLLVGWAAAVAGDDPRVAASRAYALEATVALERADNLQDLRRAATEDPLTGAANRRGLDVILAAELPVHGNTQRAVLMVDLDHFKHFNDTHGHASGDRLLKAAVASWRAELRDVDVLARYGGEEFCILLRGCPAEEVANVAERIRASTPVITASVGSACARPDEGPTELLLRADRALYRAKSAGRDRVDSGDVDPAVPLNLPSRRA